MKPGKLDLPTIWRGCDWGPVTLKWKDRNGEPIDVSAFRAIARSLNIDLNPQITDPVGGVTTLSLSKAATAELKLGVESWDWLWEHNTTPTDYRFPPFLAGKVAIKQPTSKFNGNGLTP